MKKNPALRALFREIVEEAERNPEFAARLDAVLQPPVTNSIHGTKLGPQSRPSAQAERAKNRRAPALLNPIDIARQGETTLREKLAPLSVDQLKDVVADYGMDPGKLALKWKTADRLIDRIVELAMTRSRKGDAFLEGKRAEPDHGGGS